MYLKIICLIDSYTYHLQKSYSLVTRNFWVILLMLLVAGCGKGSDKINPAPSSTPVSTSTSGPGNDCGYHNGKMLYLGSQGGCYYYNTNGNKTYVSRSECKC